MCDRSLQVCDSSGNENLADDREVCWLHASLRMGLAILDRHVLIRIGWSGIFGARTDQSIVLKLLDHMR